MNTSKLVKAAVGVVVIAVLFAVVTNWVGDYRAATDNKQSTTDQNGSGSTGGSEATTTPAVQSDSASKDSEKSTANDAPEPPSPEILVVAVDGLNFRAEPTGQARAIRGLSKGEKLTLLATQGDWFKVRDPQGVVGYVTSNPTYTDPAK